MCLDCVIVFWRAFAGYVVCVFSGVCVCIAVGCDGMVFDHAVDSMVEFLIVWSRVLCMNSVLLGLLQPVVNCLLVIHTLVSLCMQFMRLLFGRVVGAFGTFRSYVTRCVVTSRVIMELGLTCGLAVVVI